MDLGEEGQEAKQEERGIFYFATRILSVAPGIPWHLRLKVIFFFFVFLTISSQSETFVFCSLSRPSSRVSTHAFFSWNPADGVEQLKHVWLLSSLEKEVLQDWNWRGWWRTVCFPQAWAKIAGCNIFCRIQNLFWREEREMQNTDSRWRACSFLWWLAEIFIYLFIYYLHNRMWLWVWIAIFYSWSIRLAINCFMLMDCALFRSAGFSESWWCVGSCALTGWELFGEFKKNARREKSFLLPSVRLLSSFWNSAEEKENKYSCYYCV